MGIPRYDAWKTRSDIDASEDDEPTDEVADELEAIYRDLEDMTADYERLRVACAPIVAAWNHANDPGMSDLDAEQPVSLMLTKADWQRLWFAMRVKP